MSQLNEIQITQNKIEESINKRLDELQIQIKNAGSGPKETVAKVAEELRSFKELIFGVLSLLRQQIKECSNQIDEIETRSRRKALIFSGVPEKDNENCLKVLLDIITNKLGLTTITSSAIKVCHRLGSPGKDQRRPILVRFADHQGKATVWKSKTKLKGTPISVKEFLTRPRQDTFSKARLFFGMRSCWTASGVIIIKTSDGNQHKVTAMEQLMSLIKKYPKTHETPAAASGSAGSV